MLTPYEFGLHTGQYHGQLDFSMIDEERAKKLARDLKMEESTFMEGYRKGFSEGKEAKRAGKYFPTPEEIYQKQKEIEEAAWAVYQAEQIDPREHGEPLDIGGMCLEWERKSTWRWYEGEKS